MIAKQREDLFWANVDILNETNKCWEWKLSVDRYGYGKVKIHDKVCIAHRIAYELWYRINPGHLQVLHTCDNPRCCNPFHLYLGTHLDNVRDMDRKGRRKAIYKCNRKINFKIAEEIRKRCEFGEAKRKLATEYHVSPLTIRNIVNYVTWKHPPTAKRARKGQIMPVDGRKIDNSGGVGW